MFARSNRRSIRVMMVVGAALLLCSVARAAGVAEHGSINMSAVLIELIVIMIAAKVGGDVFVRFNQPAVLGELVFGIIIGNLYLVGIHGLEFLRTDTIIDAFAQVGVILLLFQVGLESDVASMSKVGLSSLVVATIGVIAPFFLGWGVAALFLPGHSIYVHLFIGATLCATSVGITARVLRDLGKLQTPEARIILGAAVIDDIQGLVVLALLQGMVTAASGSGTVSGLEILAIVAKAVLFLMGAFFLGKRVMGRLFKFADRLKSSDLMLTTSLVICFGFAYVASAIGLAPIVGAYAAGLLLDNVHWRDMKEAQEHSVDELVGPIAGFLVPIFFVLMGARVELGAFAQLSVIGFALLLTLAAIAGKQVCALGVLQKGIDRLSVGIGMIPRGEVGLIFAAVGSRLILKGEPLINHATYAAVVIMVILTTVVTPPILRWALNRNR